MPLSLLFSSTVLNSTYETYDQNNVNHQGEEPVLERVEGDVSTNSEIQGPGEHYFDHYGNLILPEVAYGTPAARREALLKRIIDKRLWVHFIRPAVVDTSRRQSKLPAAKAPKTASAMLPIGVVVVFKIPGDDNDSLARLLDKYDEFDNEKLASTLEMTAKVVEGLMPSIFQMSRIEALIAPFDEKHGPIQLTAPSLPSSRGSSAQTSNSGSEGTTTPVDAQIASASLEHALTLKLTRL
ncbi:SubName: Full=Uncharacterized protein {ECO:0000313/EMBL:CCA71784.1} [Serendipita indica DSM 11827]|nr:SubName: Full=Uncharacterized protein {ECO:0000313/EMBL:CCA71784.1} [Serendipita indica DSM 11827]